MIRNLLAAALALSVLPPAHAALRLSATDQGQALYLPYFSAEDGRATLLSISNDDLAAARAVRVIVPEARNGRVVFAGTVHLLPGDTWNGAIVAQREGPAQLVARGGERSCLVADDPVFSTANFQGANDDGRGGDDARTHRGAVEAIEIGTLHGAALAALEDGRCDALQTTLPSDLGPPAGRLSLAAELVEPASGRMWSYEAIALEGFSRTPRLDTDALRITAPQPREDGSFAVEYETSDGRTRTAVLPGTQPQDAVTLALASWALVGDYALSFDDAAQAEWVLAFPTRHAYVDDRPGGTLPRDSGPRAPFRAACDTFPILVRGRDGEPLATPIHGSVDELRLCDQVAHLKLRRPATLIPEPGEGRIWVDLADLGRTPLPGSEHFGLPAVGVTLQSLHYGSERGDAPGRSFTAAHPMRRYAPREAVKEPAPARHASRFPRSLDP